MSVFTAMKSTLRSPTLIMWLTALPPHPPAPITLILAPGSVVSLHPAGEAGRREERRLRVRPRADGRLVDPVQSPLLPVRHPVPDLRRRTSVSPALRGGLHRPARGCAARDARVHPPPGRGTRLGLAPRAPRMEVK